MPTKVSGVLDLYNPQKEFSSLNLGDLLDAREANHYDLMRLPNVVATAIGYYLIRKNEPWPRGKKVATSESSETPKPPRTLGNSEVRSYSWPCILVFVDRWVDPHDLSHHQIVPNSLPLDGRRKVPVCVVFAPRVETGNEPVRNIAWPANRLGGGFPLLAKVQGKDHIASVGCLVSDGHTTYALTNRHVAGDSGEPIYAILNGTEIEIGATAAKQLSIATLDEIYPGLHADHLRLNLDIGLIKLNDVNRWTAQVYGYPPAGPIVDVGSEDPLLNLIDCPVSGFGAASGKMRGEIKALFYRYDKKRNNEYVSDYLIGPCSEEEEQTFFTQHGDSGTIWMLEAGPDDFRPIAVQWGGHIFSEPGGETVTPYALATSLATVCDLLQVDVIRDWNLGTTEYWGEMGHYSIGAKAAALKFQGDDGSTLGLQALMNANIDRVGFDDDTLKDQQLYNRNKAHYDFVPLADVPTKELTKRGAFEPAQDEIDLVRRCLDFFGIDSPETLLASSTVAAFRKSPAFDPDDLAMCTWLRLGELEAARLTCAPFDKLEFKNALVRLRLLSREPNLQLIRAKIEELCAAVGVAVCFISELQRTHVCGAARWLTPEKALIQLSCRYESDDQFWFTFFHECAHVLLHGKKEGFLERAGSLDDEAEDEANEFAANHLIPRQAFVSLMREKPISKDRITVFAEEQQISPGIVLGQLQKRKRLPFQTNLNQLKRFKFDLTSA